MLVLEVKPCLIKQPSVPDHLRASFTLSHATQAVGGGTALTDSNSPGAGASEIGIEDRLRRERTRCTLTRAQWVPSPRSPWERRHQPPARGSKPAPPCHPTRPPSSGLCLGNSGQVRAIWVRGLRSPGESLGSQLCCPAFLRSDRPPKRQPACKGPPYLARLSHGAVVTLGLLRNVPSLSRRAGGGILKG